MSENQQSDTSESSVSISKPLSAGRPPTPPGPPPEIIDHPETLQATVSSIVSTVSVSGPLPDPRTLAGYKKVDASLPGKIVQMAQAEQAHRHEIDRLALTAQIEDDQSHHRGVRNGQLIGAGVSVAFGGAAAYLGSIGQPWLGGVLGGATLVGIVTVIVKSRRNDPTANSKEVPEVS